MSDHLSEDPVKSVIPSSTQTTPKDSYPSLLATYEEVAANPQTFMATLEELHKFIGTKFVVPTFGGKPLDLHCLFVEVTARGGLEKVIRDRKWRDVVALFSFPSTITNASFLLRKYYISLLQDYEQAYFFEAPGRPILTAKDSRSVSPAGQCQVVSTGAPDEETSENQLKVGSSIMGTINSKFDRGYVVTVNCGSEKLQGILYHSTFSSPMLSRGPSSGSTHRRIRKRSRRSARDPSHPKSNRSGYNFFFAEHYAKLKPFYHGEEIVITQKIGHLWSKLPDAEREVYQEKGMKDKERYQSEMLEYRKSKFASK